MPEALYYPYTRVKSEESLKAMILYFDKIYVISPNEASAGFDENSDFDILQSNGLIDSISPSELIQQYDRLLTKSVLGDLTDHSFLQLSSIARYKTSQKQWEIYSEKVPSSLADRLLRKYFVDIPNFYSGEQIAHFMREGPHREIEGTNLRELIKARHEIYAERTAHAEKLDNEYREFRHVTLPFEVGESLMINHAICAASRYALTPITDSEVHHRFLMLKLTGGRLRNGEQNPLLASILKDYGYIKDIKTDLTAQSIIKETVPTLTNATVEELLEFRDENKESLRVFQVELGKLSSEIQTNFWDEEFKKQIIDIIDSKIKPSIEDLKCSVESTKEKLARIFKRGVEISPLPIFAYVVPGCDPQLALAISAGLIGLSEYLEYSKQSNVRKKNGFTYLFNLQNEFAI
jgi:hypothetical protein